MLVSLLDYSVAGFGGIFCIVWAVGLALSSTTQTARTAVAFVLISGVRLLWEAYFLSGLYTSSPAIYLFCLPLMYAIGPILLAYYDGLAGRTWKGQEYLHFAFPLFAAVPLLFLPESDNVSGLIDEVYSAKRSGAGWLLVGWILGPKLLILAYSLCIPLRRSAEGARALKSLSPEIRPFAHILLVFVWTMILADIAGYICALPLVFRASVWSHALAVILVYWFSRHQPSAMLEFSRALHRVRYARSKLAGLNVEETLARLNALMSEEAYYADEDMRLPGLASALDLSSHQLSELINSHLNLSFAEFINGHRVEAACKMLEEDGERSILSVALAVGFNSKSSFNRAFRQIKGITPGEFRKKATGGDG